MVLFIEAKTVVTTQDLKDLLGAWRMYGHTNLIRTFRCDAALTDAQIRRLPKGLQAQLSA